MGGKAANLNSVLENQDSDLHQQVAFSDTTDTIHVFYVQISDKQKKVWSSAFGRSAVIQSGAALIRVNAELQTQIPARLRIDFTTVPASNTSLARA
jgi:hypothetical protein